MSKVWPRNEAVAVAREAVKKRHGDDRLHVTPVLTILEAMGLIHLVDEPPMLAPPPPSPSGVKLAVLADIICTVRSRPTAPYTDLADILTERLTARGFKIVRSDP